MSLERFGTHLDDYLDGCLGEEERRELEAFLASSPAARRELEEYRRLIDSLAALPESIEPERDLFAAIERRLDGPATAPRRRAATALAAAAVLAAALGLAYLAARPAATEAPAAAAIAARPAAATVTSRAESDLAAAAEELRRALDVHRDGLPPETRRLVERNLEIIRMAIAEIELALDRDPGNQELNRALVAYYQHELALLERINRAAARL